MDIDDKYDPVFAVGAEMTESSSRRKRQKRGSADDEDEDIEMAANNKDDVTTRKVHVDVVYEKSLSSHARRRKCHSVERKTLLSDDDDGVGQQKIDEDEYTQISQPKSAPRYRCRLKSTEWTPGLVTRALVIGLGYVVGSRAYDAPNGLGTITFLIVLIIGNEFFAFSLKCVKAVMIGNNPRADNFRDDDDENAGGPDYFETWNSPYNEELVLKAERILVIVRYFAFTAITYAINEALKKLFDDVDEHIGTVVILISIIVLNEALESLFANSDNNRCYHRRQHKHRRHLHYDGLDWHPQR